MTITSVKRRGRQMDSKFDFRGRKFRVDLMPKAKFELVAKEDVDKVVDIIMRGARTREIGDDKIFTYTIEQAIRTGEKGGKCCNLKQEVPT